MNSAAEAVTHAFVYVDGPVLAPGQWTWRVFEGRTTPYAMCSLCGGLLHFDGFDFEPDGVAVRRGKQAGRVFVCAHRQSNECTMRGKLQLVGYAEHRPRN